MGKKKEKKGEKKLVLQFEPKVYNKIYSKLYNNKLMSDITFKFEKTGNIIHSHKLILNISSDYFERLFDSGMQESQTNEILIPEDEDEELFKDLLEYFYSGKLNLKNEQYLVEFIIFANKYLVKNIKDFKVSQKTLLNGVIGIIIFNLKDYINKDVNERYSEFEELCENIEFKVTFFFKTEI
jgi:hypothetical protein